MSADFVSFKDVCEKLSLTERQLTKYISEGEIRAFREGDELRFRRSDVDFLEMRMLEEKEELNKIKSIEDELDTSDVLRDYREPAFGNTEDDGYIDDVIDEYEDEISPPKKLTLTFELREEDLKKIHIALKKFDRSTIVKDILNAIILGLAFVAGMFFAKM